MNLISFPRICIIWGEPTLGTKMSINKIVPVFIIKLVLTKNIFDLALYSFFILKSIFEIAFLEILIKRNRKIHMLIQKNSKSSFMDINEGQAKY